MFGPARKLDFELETAFVVGEGNALGEPIPVSEAERHIFGMVLLNDWSARDIQQWEYVPLGPFNAKTFAHVDLAVDRDARRAGAVSRRGPAQEPAAAAVSRAVRRARASTFTSRSRSCPRGGGRATIWRTNFSYLYWSMAQQLAHHTVSGCNTRVGDLMASGTISGPTPDSFGSLLELAWNGQKPIELPNGGPRGRSSRTATKSP